MFSLTNQRLAKAEAVLEKYREELFARRSFDAGSLERELRELWNTGYQEIKSIALQLLKMERYRELAAYYMEHSNAAVVEEFKMPLASLYGLALFDVPEREGMRRAFWNNVFGAGQK